MSRVQRLAQKSDRLVVLPLTEIATQANEGIHHGGRERRSEHAAPRIAGTRTVSRRKQPRRNTKRDAENHQRHREPDAQEQRYVQRQCGAAVQRTSRGVLDRSHIEQRRKTIADESGTHANAKAVAPPAYEHPLTEPHVREYRDISVSLGFEPANAFAPGEPGRQHESLTALKIVSRPKHVPGHPGSRARGTGCPA